MLVQQELELLPLPTHRVSLSILCKPKIYQSYTGTGSIVKQHHVLRANIAMQDASGMHSAQRSQGIPRSLLASTSTLPLQVVPQYHNLGTCWLQR